MEEKSTTASRSIAVALLVLALIALTVIAPSSWFGSKAKSENQKLTIDVSRIKNKKAIATDTNGDGQVTWKEVIQETVPMDEQTKENLKNQKVDPKAIEALNDPNNLTASFSKNLYLGAVTLQKNNITDQETKQVLVDNLAQIEANKIKRTTYTDRDIVISKTENKETIKIYGNSLAPLLENVITKEMIEKGFLGFANYTKTNDMTSIIYLQKEKKRLDTLVEKIADIPTPPSALLYHIKMVNRVAAYRDIIDNLSKAENDPMRAIFVFEQYVPISRLVVSMFEEYSDYFNKQNVTFLNKEPGYVFITGYTLH